MLIWIKATSAAIGVLAIFLLLLGAASSEEVNANTAPEEGPTTTLASTVISEPNSIRISQLPFARTILHPCFESPVNSRSRVEFEADLMRQISCSMLIHANSYRRYAQQVLNQDTMPDCSSLEIGNLPNTPSLEELQALNTTDAFNRIYHSLLMHSAYAYFINYQLNSSSDRCSADLSFDLISKSRELGNKQINLACIFRATLTLIGRNQVNTTEVVNEEITDLNNCSKRQMRDCQVIRSTVHLLNVIETLIQTYIPETECKPRK